MFTRSSASLIFTYVILGIAIVMLVWGVLGFFEYLTGVTALVPLQNDLFPPGIQFLHWVMISGFGVVFLGGYVTRWHYTPPAMVFLFGMLATLCFVQTFDFLDHDLRYVAFVLECAAYLAIGTFLMRSKRMKQRFHRQ